jgi:NitT/TauT family transport system ATP-binding protein
MEAVRLADRLLMMAPGPGRIVGEFKLERPRLARGEMWVYQATARFMQAPEVRAGFGLPPNLDRAERLVASSQAPAGIMSAARWHRDGSRLGAAARAAAAVS